MEFANGICEWNVHIGNELRNRVSATEIIDFQTRVVNEKSKMPSGSASLVPPSNDSDVDMDAGTINDNFQNLFDEVSAISEESLSSHV